MIKLSVNSRRIIGSVAAILVLTAWSASSQAQECIVTNWLGGQPGLSNDDAGTPAESNESVQYLRYAGPCGLRVPMGDGTARYVVDNTPAGEGQYIARFYTFLNDAGSEPMIIFEADDGAATPVPQIQVWYNVPSANDLTLRIYDSGNDPHVATFSNVGTGWHSVEFSWVADAAAAIAFTVNGDDDQTITPPPNTSGITIANARLGNINGATSAVGARAIHFDDFDSRRASRPGRLCRGDVNGSDTITQTDMLIIFNEVVSGGTALAGGQPDYNENGDVTQTDFLQVFNQHVISGVPACP